MAQKLNGSCAQGKGTRRYSWLLRELDCCEKILRIVCLIHGWRARYLAYLNCQLRSCHFCTGETATQPSTVQPVNENAFLVTHARAYMFAASSASSGGQFQSVGIVDFVAVNNGQHVRIDTTSRHPASISLPGPGKRYNNWPNPGKPRLPHTRARRLRKRLLVSRVSFQSAWSQPRQS